MSDTHKPWPTRLRAAMSALFGGAGRAPAVQRRAYAAARPSRFNVGLGSAGNSSADAELHLALAQLRAASRQMVRDAPYAKRAKAIVVNNVIGAGIGLQAQVRTTRDELATRVNDEIETAWSEWARPDSCHTGGALHFHDLERACMGQVFEAGEVFVRMHYARFGRSRVPLALELVEPERLAPDHASPGAASPDQEIRMGIEVDRFQRAVAYWVRTRHPGDVRKSIASEPDQYVRVPASDMFHLRLVDRWPQSRGEPWLHTVLRKLDSMNEYSAAELQAAQADAAVHGTIESSAPDMSGAAALANNTAEQAEGDKPEVQLENGVIQELAPGEKLNLHTPTRPNTALDPFLRYMLREAAAGIGVSYESISRDYSQSNYSSSRLSLLDDRDTWRVLQQWWVRAFREPLHQKWLEMAVVAGAMASIPGQAFFADSARYMAVKFKPRGWNWVDPTKEVAAYKEAIKAGLTTITDVIAQTADGRDIEDVVETRKRELAMFEEADIAVDTTVQEPPEPGAGPPDDGDESNTTQNDPPARVVSLAR